MDIWNKWRKILDDFCWRTRSLLVPEWITINRPPRFSVLSVNRPLHTHIKNILVWKQRTKHTKTTRTNRKKMEVTCYKMVYIYQLARIGRKIASWSTERTVCYLFTLKEKNKTKQRALVCFQLVDEYHGVQNH